MYFSRLHWRTAFPIIHQDVIGSHMFVTVTTVMMMVKDALLWNGLGSNGSNSQLSLTPISRISQTPRVRELFVASIFFSWLTVVSALLITPCVTGSPAFRGNHPWSPQMSLPSAQAVMVFTPTRYPHSLLGFQRRTSWIGSLAVLSPFPSACREITQRGPVWCPGFWFLLLNF